MKQLTILRGMPGCGKTTRARSHYSQSKRINKDDLRAMLDNSVWSKDNENFIRKAQDALVRLALEEGFSVVVDNTHLDQTSIKALHFLAEDVGGVTVVEEWLDTPAEECRQRNRAREGLARVPDQAMNKFAKLHKPGPTKTREYPAHTTGAAISVGEGAIDLRAPAIICDLDGTLALFDGQRSPYDTAKCGEDRLNEAVAEVLNAILDNGGQVIFVSGREDKFRAVTSAWLTNQGYRGWDLFMRATGDMRRDSIIKREIYEQHIAPHYNVKFVLDDRNQVVKMWRSLGLSCFQVNEGRF